MGMRKAIWPFIGILGAGLAIIAQTSAQNAKSNLESWLNLIGFNPKWVHFNNVATIVGIGTFFLGIGFLYWASRKSPKTDIQIRRKNLELNKKILSLENTKQPPQSVLQIKFNEADSHRTQVVNELGLDRGFCKAYYCNIYNSNEVNSVRNVAVELHYKGKFFPLEWRKGKPDIELSAGKHNLIKLISFKNAFPSKEILIGETNKVFISDYDKKYNFTVVVTGAGQPPLEKEFIFAFTTEGGSYEFKVYEATSS